MRIKFPVKDPSTNHQTSNETSFWSHSNFSSQVNGDSVAAGGPAMATPGGLSWTSWLSVPSIFATAFIHAACIWNCVFSPHEIELWSPDHCVRLSHHFFSACNFHFGNLFVVFAHYHVSRSEVVWLDLFAAFCWDPFRLLVFSEMFGHEVSQGFVWCYNNYLAGGFTASCLRLWHRHPWIKGMLSCRTENLSASML